MKSKLKFSLIILSVTVLAFMLFIMFYFLHLEFINLDNRMEVIIETTDQLGFIDERVAFEKKDRAPKYYVFYEIDKGGVFDKAGFQKDDEILITQNELYSSILFNQESEITIPIRRDGTDMNISVYIPKLELSIDPATLHWK